MSAEAAWPRVGCGAAIARGEKLLLVKRRRAPEAGCWGLPGGKVDPFETVAGATAREIYEELGIKIEPAELLCIVEQIDRAEGHWIAPVFYVTRFDGTPEVMEPEALSAVDWFDMRDLSTDLTHATKQAVSAIMVRRNG